MNFFSNLEIPWFPIGRAFESMVDWAVANLPGFFDLISTVIESVEEAIATFFSTPAIIVFGIVCGVVGLGLKGWKVGVGALVAGLLVAQGVALVGLASEFLFIAAFGVLAWALRGWKAGVLSALGFVLIGAMGQWENAMSTLSLVLLAGALAVLLSIPVGIAAGVNPTVKRVISPVLDFMQTMPAFVYLIPAVSLFGIGPVPGVVATIIFSMPPGVRLTALGIEQVDREVVEAGESFGASPSRILARIQLPLALPTIMAGINQVIMLSLSMVVIAGMVGAGGLGRAVYGALTGGQPAMGFEAGLGVVILAMYLDRVTNALASRAKVVKAQNLAAER